MAKTTSARSIGAEYVKRLDNVIHAYDEEPVVPTLLWSPTLSWYCDGKGNWRQIWGLEDQREARALCMLKSVNFKMDSSKHKA